jgi:hypothetical protein
VSGNISRTGTDVSGSTRMRPACTADFAKRPGPSASSKLAPPRVLLSPFSLASFSARGSGHFKASPFWVVCTTVPRHKLFA